MQVGADGERRVGGRFPLESAADRPAVIEKIGRSASGDAVTPVDVPLDRQRLIFVIVLRGHRDAAADQQRCAYRVYVTFHVPLPSSSSCSGSELGVGVACIVPG